MQPRFHNLLSIGSFAQASQLSIKALRLYADLHILRPSFIDESSGYRYYQAGQLEAARLIRLMREMDMPLATIRQVLAAAPADAEVLVAGYWQDQEKRMAQARGLMHDLIASFRQKSATLILLEVTVKPIEPQAIISMTQRVTIDALVGTVHARVQRLRALADQHGWASAGTPFGIYHGSVNPNEDGPVEVCLPVIRPVIGPLADAGQLGEVQARVLPGGQAASATLYGDQCSFPAVLQGYDATADWIDHHGYEEAEAPREIWHQLESDRGHAFRHDLCLEVQWLFKEKN